MAYIALSQNSWTEQVRKSFGNLKGIEITDKKLVEIEDGAVVYIMPFLNVEEISQNEERLRIVNSLESMLVSLDKLETSRRLIQEKVSTPETLISDDFEDLINFVRRKNHSILKNRFECGGEGHFILTYENGKLKATNGKNSYSLNQGSKKKIFGGKLFMPAPFYAQEMILEHGDYNDTVYRAYVVGNRVTFSTLRTNHEVKTMGESIINVAKGAKYSFMQDLPEEMEELSLRAAKAIGFDIGTIDLVRDQRGKFYVIETTLDSHQIHICRKFMHAEGYNQRHDLNRQIAKRLLEIEASAEN